MAWRHLIITHPAKLSYKNRQLIIQMNTDIKQLPLNDIHTIVVSTTRAVITTYLLQKIVENHIKLIFCDENYDPCAEISGYYQNVNRNTNIRKQISWSDEQKLPLWDALVRMKVTSQAMMLKSLNLDNRQILNALSEMAFGDSTNREAVVAKYYFPMLFGESFTRQDDNDINAALNYGYTILLSCFNREITAQGYLTELGIHHESMQNDFNLSSDLMEPFRVFVDAIVKKHEKEPFGQLVKYDLVDVLNTEIDTGNQTMYLENFIADVVKQSIGYLNQEAELPSWSVVENAG